MQAAGVNVPGYCNMPSSKAQATSRVAKLKALGVRVYRAHHIDVLWRDHKTAHLPRLQWMFDALKSARIPIVTEFASSVYDKLKLADWHWPAGWLDYVEALCALDLSNVVAACPVNEPATTSQEVYGAQCKVIRGAGFKGILFGGSGFQTGNPAGDLADWHIYCAHDNGIDYQREFYTPRFFGDMPAHHKPKRSKLPTIATEVGHMWPAPERGISERQIVDSLLDVGCQVVCPFQLVNKDEEWNSGTKPSMWNMSDDPLRMETLAYIAHRINGLPYIPDTGITGFKAQKVEDGPKGWGDVWRVV